MPSVRSRSTKNVQRTLPSIGNADIGSVVDADSDGSSHEADISSHEAVKGVTEPPTTPSRGLPVAPHPSENVSLRSGLHSSPLQNSLGGLHMDVVDGLPSATPQQRHALSLSTLPLSPSRGFPRQPSAASVVSHLTGSPRAESSNFPQESLVRKRKCVGDSSDDEPGNKRRLGNDRNLVKSPMDNAGTLPASPLRLRRPRRQTPELVPFPKVSRLGGTRGAQSSVDASPVSPMQPSFPSGTFALPLRPAPPVRISRTASPFEEAKKDEERSAIKKDSTAGFGSP